MLTLPVKNRRKKQPYLAIRSRLVNRQILKQAQLFLPEIRKFMHEAGIADFGPSFFRYNAISPAGEIDMEFGHFTDKLYTGSGPIRAGILPGGSFVSVAWTGHWEKLPDVSAMLMGWGEMKGVGWDCASTEAGLIFGCRIDIFHTSAPDKPNPGESRTEVALMLKADADAY